MTTKLQYRMSVTETDITYLTSHFVKLPDADVYHNMLKDMSTACGMQLVGVLPHYLKSEGEPRCGNCVRGVDAIVKRDSDEFLPEDIYPVKQGTLSEFFSSIGSECIPSDGEKHLLVIRWDRATGLRDVRVDDKKMDVQFELPDGMEQGTMWDWVINPTEEGNGTADLD